MSCMKIIGVSWCFCYLLNYVTSPLFNNVSVLKIRYLSIHKKQCFFCFTQDK